MISKRLLVYALQRDKGTEFILENLRETTPHEYLVVSDIHDLARRLNRGSVRPRVIVIDDGHPCFDSNSGERLVINLRKITTDPTPPIIVATTGIRPQSKDGGDYFTALRRLGVCYIHMPERMEKIRNLLERVAQ